MASLDVTPAPAELTGFTEPLLQRLYSYWLARKGERRFPERGDIDPLDFPYLLGNILLIDMVRNPLRFRFRVHGTEMTRRARFHWHYRERPRGPSSRSGTRRCGPHPRAPGDRRDDGRASRKPRGIVMQNFSCATAPHRSI